MIGARVRRLFFDSAAVLNRMDRAARRNLSKVGAYVRQRARTSIRKRKKESPPGKPPSSHTGELRNSIIFSADLRGGVVIGPTRGNMVSFRIDGQPVKGTVPETLETGGAMKVVEEKMPGGWVRADLRSRRRRRERRTRVVSVAARPFMKPALVAERQRIPAMWRDCIRA